MLSRRVVRWALLASKDGRTFLAENHVYGDWLWRGETSETRAFRIVGAVTFCEGIPLQ